MKFNECWKIPENAKEFFSPKKEKELKEKYGKYYTLHTIVGIVILLSPFIAFFFIAPLNEASTNFYNILGAIGGFLGFVGSISIGIGLLNIFMILVKQYLGHLVTIISIVGGIVLDCIGWFVLSFVK